MFGNWRRESGRRGSTFGPLGPGVVGALLALLVAGTARADDAGAAAPSSKPIELRYDNLFSMESGSSSEAALPDWVEQKSIELAKVWAADFHPETDRWTERNNRIKISLFASGLFFGNNLRVNHDAGIGMRLAWEVPGFIGIRLDSVVVPWSHIDTRIINSNTNNGRRYLQGFVDCTSLSIAIFNPELSYTNLVMWAGFGFDVWSYHYKGLISGARYSYVDYNVGGNFFFDLQYKITDIFHVGFGIREHIVYAPQTAQGRGFIKVNGHTRGTRYVNDRGLDPIYLSAVHEFQITLSVLF